VRRTSATNRGDISSNVQDTPWDEPTEHSYEFSRYVAGSFIDDDPWNRIPAPLFCSSSIPIPSPSSLTHPWLALITGLLTINPRDRMTLADAFQHPWALTYVRQCGTKGCLGVYLPLTDKANWHPRVPWYWRRNSPSLSVIQAILT
jgi:hypothetical protein